MAERIKLAHGMETRLGLGHIVLDGDTGPLPKRHSPQVSVHICSGQTAGWIKMPLGWKVGLNQSTIVLDRHPAPPPRRGTALNFRSMSIVTKRLNGLRCHMAWRWASAQATLLDGDQFPPERCKAPVFRPCLLWPNGWMDEDAT